MEKKKKNLMTEFLYGVQCSFNGVLCAVYTQLTYIICRSVWMKVNKII